MATYRGIGVNFGISSSLANITGAMQTRDHQYRSETEMVRNSYGDTVAKIYYDASEEATFSWIATGTSGGSITVTLPTIGALLTVTDAGYTQIAGTTWLVDDVSTAGSNTGAVKVTAKLSKYPNITS